jgi:hypothetical protein
MPASRVWRQKVLFDDEAAGTYQVYLLAAASA